MARTLFIVKDRIYLNLNEIVRDLLLEELRKIFKFIVGFKIKPTVAADFPQALDLSDSVVRIVETKLDGSAFVNSAWRKQYHNVRKGIIKLGIEPPAYSPPRRFPAAPERYGSAFHAKQVVRAGQISLAIPYMAGWISLNAVKEDASDLAKSIRPKETRKAPWSKKALTYWMSADSLLHTKDILELEGRLLARGIAHEARHEYVLEHADTKLGSDSAITSDGNDTRFSSKDQKEISGAIARFEHLQKFATLVPLVAGSGELPF